MSTGVRDGWSYLHPGFVFTPDDQPFVIMARPRLLAMAADERRAMPLGLSAIL